MAREGWPAGFRIVSLTEMELVEGGITAVPGIVAAGISAGIKKTAVPDLALIVSEKNAVIAGVLTRRTDRKLLAHLPGGDLALEWADNNHVFMTGPAKEVFSGDWPG